MIKINNRTLKKLNKKKKNINQVLKILLKKMIKMNLYKK